MSVIRYSPHPSEFYTFTAEGGNRVGLGAGQSAYDPGFWNIAWLTHTQCDDHSDQDPLPDSVMAVWTPHHEKHFSDTAGFRLSGIAISTLATVLTAAGFVEYVTNHSEAHNIPLTKKFGAAWMNVARMRALKAVNIIVEGAAAILVRPPAPSFELADEKRTKRICMGDWAAKVCIEVKH